MDPEIRQTASEKEPQKSLDSILVRSRLFRWPYEFLPSVVHGTGIAGGLYPVILLFLVHVIFTVRTNNWGSLFWSTDFSTAMMFAMPASFFIGYFYAGLFCAFISMLVRLILNSLRVDQESVVVGAFTGGLTGFVCTLPFVLILAMETDFYRLFFLTAVATLLGPIGSAWGAWRVLRLELSAGPASSLLSTIHFRINHMLWITFWCVLLLTGMKLTGLLTEPVITFFGIWFVFQTISLAVIWRIEQALHRRELLRIPKRST